VQYFLNAVRPVNAPYGNVRFTWNLVFPVKRGLKIPE
jgi:hypothetical protein